MPQAKHKYKMQVVFNVVEINVPNFSDIVTITAKFNDKQWASSMTMNAPFTLEHFSQLIANLSEAIKKNDQEI